MAHMHSFFIYIAKNVPLFSKFSFYIFHLRNSAQKYLILLLKSTIEEDADKYIHRLFAGNAGNCQVKTRNTHFQLWAAIYTILRVRTRRHTGINELNLKSIIVWETLVCIFYARHVFIKLLGRFCFYIDARFSPKLIVARLLKTRLQKPNHMHKRFKHTWDMHIAIYQWENFVKQAGEQYGLYIYNTYFYM